jgi:hypothetical protein
MNLGYIDSGDRCQQHVLMCSRQTVTKDVYYVTSLNWYPIFIHFVVRFIIFLTFSCMLHYTNTLYWIVLLDDVSQYHNMSIFVFHTFSSAF